MEYITGPSVLGQLVNVPEQLASFPEQLVSTTEQLRKCSGAVGKCSRAVSKSSGEVTKVFRSSYESSPKHLISLPEHFEVFLSSNNSSGTFISRP